MKFLQFIKKYRLHQREMKYYITATGEQINRNVYIPCYYMRLKHMVKDKINYRAQGHVQF